MYSQRVVHPAHVPLEVEAEPALVDGPRDAGPGGRLLGDGQAPRRPLGDKPVGAAHEVDRLEVLAPAMSVRDPLAGRARIVEVEHRGDRIDAQRVDAVLLEPEERVRRQEVRDLPSGRNCRSACSSPCGSPGADPRARRAPCRRSGRAHGRPRGSAPGTQSMMTRKFGLVAGVHQPAKAFRVAEAGGRREQADRLVAPGAAERMLGDRQELEMREAHIGRVGDEALGELVIAQHPVVFVGTGARTRDAPRRSTSAPRAPRPAGRAIRRAARCGLAQAVDDRGRPRGAAPDGSRPGSALSGIGLPWAPSISYL